MFDAAALVLEEIAPEDKNRNEVLGARVNLYGAQRNRFETAAGHLCKALRLTEVTSERSFLEKKLREFEEQAS